jgi:peptide/nickel transport system permease protein
MTSTQRAPRSVVAIGILAAAATLAVSGAWLAPHDPLQLASDVALHSHAPSRTYWLGTDPLGRDIASRLLAGARYSVGIAAAALALAVAVGSSVGAMAALLGGRRERLLMRLVDSAVAVPRLVLLLAIVGLWGGASPTVLVVVLGATGWFDLARLVRRAVRAQLVEERVAAARALGVGRGRLLRTHLLPDLTSLVAVWASSEFGGLILLETGLSFLGLGIPAPTPSWGRVLLETGDVFGPGRWLVLGPGLLIATVVGASYALGDRPRTLGGEGRER